MTPLDYDPLHLTLLIVVIITFDALVKKERTRPKVLLPPYVKSGYIETLKIMSSFELPLGLLRWAKETGPFFRFPVPFKTIIVSNDLSFSRKLLNDRKSYKPVQIYKYLMPENLLNCEGYRWKHARKSIAPAFSANNIRRMNKVALGKTDAFMETTLEKYVKVKTSFDLCSEMLYLTLSVIGDAAFEYDITKEEADIFLTDIRNVMNVTKYAYIKNVLPVRNKLGRLLPGAKEALRSVDSLADFGWKILECYKENKSPQKGTVIDCIVNDKEYKSDSERVDDIVIVLIAGHDTTAYALAWTLLELAKHPEEQDSLRESLRRLSLDERRQSPEFKNVIKEVMRLYPGPSMASVRCPTEDILVKDETNQGRFYKIPKGVIVMCPIFLLMRNPKYYDEPDEFRPSRWNNPSPEALRAFLPYSTGRRDCVGQALANAEIATVISNVICKYKFTVADCGKFYFSTTLKPKGARLFVSKCD